MRARKSVSALPACRARGAFTSTRRPANGTCTPPGIASYGSRSGAVDPGLFKLRLKEVCAQLEKEFALREVSNHRQPHDRARAAERKEVEEARRLGTDVRTIRTAILDCFEHSDNGRAFKAALDERGLMLANGDRRDCFVVIDQAGGHHALNKKLTGQTLAETRTRFADIDRAQLPSVEQAKELQAEIAARRSAPEIQPEQASHRYDPLYATERAVERAQFKGRYDELREAEPPPEVARLFEVGATRAAEPPTIDFDRDAADAAWMEKVAAAGIASDAVRAAQESRQPAELAAGRETRAGAGEPAYAQPQAQEAAREIAPEPSHGMRDLEDIGGRFLGGLGKAIIGISSASSATWSRRRPGSPRTRRKGPSMSPTNGASSRPGPPTIGDRRINTTGSPSSSAPAISRARCKSIAW